MNNMLGKVVLITGAASGIGRATAKKFHQEGADVVLVDEDSEALKDIAICYQKNACLTITANVSQEKEVQRVIKQTIKKFGQLDVLVNNAGIHAQGTVTETSLKKWNHVLTVDVGSVFLMSKYAMPYLIKTKGCIINTSSVSGLGADPATAAYNAAKGAVTNLTRSMAIDHAEAGVRVNAVNPTFTRTGMTEEDIKDKNTLKKYIDRIPMGRIGEAEDIAGAIFLLASDEAKFITGINLPVDGGVSASNGQPIHT